MRAQRGSPGRRLAAVAAGGAATAVLALVLLWLSLPDVADLATRTPRSTALIEQRRTEARRSGRRYLPEMRPVALERIAPRLAEAVILSEDAGFFGHGPFDFREIQEAAEHNVKARRFVRGASTLTQQLAKNLYLGTEKSLVRKGREAVLAVKLERALSKRHILALYLNVVEWGEGVFGAEAAARARFGVSAAELTTAQAAALAAMLPAPRRADLAAPSPWLERRARHVVDLLLEYGRIDAAEHAHASAELERLLSGRAGDDAEEPPVE